MIDILSDSRVLFYGEKLNMPVGHDSGIVSLTNGCINGTIFNSNNDTPNIPNFSIIIQKICAHFYLFISEKGY